MGKQRLVTREIADTIYKIFEVLRILDGLEQKKAYEKIQSDIFDEFGIEISTGTISFYCYQTFDEVRGYQKNYSHSEIGKETRRLYRQTESCKESHRRYDRSEKGKISRKKYLESEKGKKSQRKAQEKYSQTEKYKDTVERYLQKLTKSRNEEFPSVIHVFPDLYAKLSPKQVWSDYGGKITTVRNDLNKGVRKHALKKIKEGRNVFFMPDSEGFFKMKESFIEA